MIAVIGAGGQLGTAFQALLPEAAFLTRTDLDLGIGDSIGPTLDRFGPDTVINCAAYTAVDRAEQEEDLATQVNGRAVGELASWAKQRGARLVTFSTDYVFDGVGERPYLESDPTDPINAYGRSKLRGEELALAVNPDTLVIRTSWVISGTHPNFVATMIRRGREQQLRVVDDQLGCPTIADDLAAASLEALDRGVGGVLHLTNQGATTWFRLARRTVELAGLDPEVIQPCATADYPTPARRPAYSVLGSERISELESGGLPPWEGSLPGVVERLLRWM